MVIPGRDVLTGTVEIGETFVGGPGLGCQHDHYTQLDAPSVWVAVDLLPRQRSLSGASSWSYSASREPGRAVLTDPAVI